MGWAHLLGGSVQVSVVDMDLDARRELHDDLHARHGNRKRDHQLHERRGGDVGLVVGAELVPGVVVHPLKGEVQVLPDDPRQPFPRLLQVHLSPALPY